MFLAGLFLAVVVGLWTDEVLSVAPRSCYDSEERRHSPLQNATWKAGDVSELLTYLFECYDNRVRPTEIESTVISMGLYIISISDFDVRDMTYSISFYFRMMWKDQRLAFGSHYHKDMIFLGGPIFDDLWHPAPYFLGKKGKGYVNKDSFHVRVYRNGTVMSSTQNSLTVHCNMDLRDFPMDEQTCRLSIASYMYLTDDVLYQWSPGGLFSAIELDPHMTFSDFALDPVVIEEYNSSYALGSFSELRLGLTFRRRIIFYLIQIYLPTSMIVVLSWISFWIDCKAVPARTALGITTVLAMTTLIFGVESSLPKVPYVKGIDLFLIVSFASVFGAVVEFAVVNYLNTKESTLPKNGGRKRVNIRNVKVKPVSTKDQVVEEGFVMNDCRSTNGLGSGARDKLQETFGIGDNVMSRDPEPDVTPSPPDSRPPSDNTVTCHLYCRNISAHSIDAYSRVLFPFMYMLFVFVYLMRHLVAHTHSAI